VKLSDVARNTIKAILKNHGIEPAQSAAKKTCCKTFLAAHWDGTSWTVVPTAEPEIVAGNSSLGSLAVVSANDIYASGNYQGQNTNLHQHRTLIEHWDGSAWSVVQTPTPGESADLGGIAAAATGEMWAVGLYSDYPVNIYDGTYTVPKTLVLSGGKSHQVSDVPGVVEVGATLSLPRPNPSSDRVSLTVHLPQRAAIGLGVLDVRGREVRSLIRGGVDAGDHAVTWDGLDAHGRTSEPGVYYARLVIDGRVVASRSVVLMRETTRSRR